MNRRRSNEISNAGFSFGYFGGMLALVLSAPMIFLFFSVQRTLEQEARYLGLQLAMVLTGAWWLGFYWLTFKALRPRPGTPMVGGFSQAWCSTLTRNKSIFFQASTSQSASLYLLIWFIFSDGVSVCASIAVLFAEAEVDWGCIPKGVGLWSMMTITGLFAGVGSHLAPRVQTMLQLETKTMLMTTLCTVALVPAWAIVGVWSRDFGLRTGWEMLAISSVFGSCLGPMQGLSRAMYSELIPEGQEAAYFSLYQLTDKGSGFVGPLVVSAVIQATGNMRYSLFYPLGLIGVALGMLALYDFEAAASKIRSPPSSSSAPVGGMQNEMEMVMGPVVVQAGVPAAQVEGACGLVES